MGRGELGRGVARGWRGVCALGGWLGGQGLVARGVTGGAAWGCDLGV